jgi:hypothetical protein
VSCVISSLISPDSMDSFLWEHAVTAKLCVERWPESEFVLQTTPEHETAPAAGGVTFVL